MPMTDEQHAFWRALTAPFPREAYLTRPGQGGKEFTYIKTQVIENRLDDVCGPGKWSTDFQETTRGVICKLTIFPPDGGVVTKSWGGGFKNDMQTEDSSYKTGFSNAFKATASKFGIGRDLYQVGMPSYCADLHNARASGMPQDGPSAGPGPQTQAPPQRQSYGNGDGHVDPPRPQYDNFKPPYGRAGTKAPFAWGKNMGTHFKIDVLGKMIDYARKRKKPERTDQWDEGFLDECLAKTVEWIKGLDNYDGEFGGNGAPVAEAAPSGKPADFRGVISSIVAATVALSNKMHGRPPTESEIVAMIGEVASSVVNGSGHRGEVLQSLKGCTDGVWLKNILADLNKRISEAAQYDAGDVAEEDSDCPF
jgi:hypothetical protein